jgi:hypothetical protein
LPRAQEGATASDMEDFVKGALQLIVLAKKLKEEVLQYRQECPNPNPSDDNILLYLDCYKERTSIAQKATELRDTMVNYLIELASKVPLNKEEYVNAINILYSLNPYEPEKTIASDVFLELYTSLILSATYTKGGAPPTPVFVPIPGLQPQEGTKTKGQV